MATRSLPQHSSVYQIITEQITRQLEQGACPWRKPWRCETPRNLISKREYHGLNVLLLATQGYGSPSWVTFNQAKQLGGHVRKGEHGTLITYWRFDKKTGANEDGETESKVIPLLRYFTVFNVEQCEGFSALHETRPASNAIGTCESIVKAMPNPPRYDQSWRACYRPSTDTVSMPAKTALGSLEAYFSTLFHELSHSTGHASRVGREGIEKLERFGSESYSREELVAELGAAMLCGVAGIAPSVIENSASYMQSWLTVLKTDSRLIVQAASAAQRAADYIRGINVADGEESASA